MEDCNNFEEVRPEERSYLMLKIYILLFFGLLIVGAIGIVKLFVMLINLL